VTRYTARTTSLHAWLIVVALEIGVIVATWMVV